MKLLSVAILSFLSSSALAARKGVPSDGFIKFHTEQLSAPGALKLDQESYDELINGPRNYSSVVLLTAQAAQFSCQLCKDFQPEWDLLARSWVKGDRAGESRVVFGTLDFFDGKLAFQKLQLQTVPILVVYPPTIGEYASKASDPYKWAFTDGSADGDKIHGWISRHIPGDVPRPKIQRPVNYTKFVVIVTSLVGGITVLFVASPYLLPIVQNRNLWAAITLIAVLLFTSGHMFNHIRNVPYVSGDGNGGLSYFAGGFQNQFGLETQIVAAMYGILAFATIQLAMKVPRIKDPKLQQVSVFVWSAVLLGMYSFLLSVFRMKNGGYPFWLPPF